MVAPYRTASIEARLVGSDATAVTVVPQASKPIVLHSNGLEVLRISVTPSSLVVAGHISVTARGGSLYARIDHREMGLPLGPGYKWCSSIDASGVWHCQLPVRIHENGSVDLAAATATTEVLGVEYSIVKASVGSVAKIDSLLWLFAVLSLAGILFLVFRVSISLKLTLLTSIGALWLVASSAVWGAIVLGLVIAYFFLLRFQMRLPASKMRIAAVIFAVVAVFVFIKGPGDDIARMFANPGGVELGLPLGFAFFAIRALDLSFRVGTHELGTLGLKDYFAYMLFPATLPAGPIFSFNQLHQSAVDNVGFVDWTAGFARMAVGVSKKVLADIILAKAVSPNLTLLYADPGSMQSGVLWILLATNALYVYLDFAGYSDIAIGAGRQLGWRVPENFDHPFLQSSLRAFWRRWHMTLSNWVVRWVHFFTAFSLRRSSTLFKASIPVITSLAIIGMWHELQLTWLAWGLHHAVGILIGDAMGLFTVRVKLATTLRQVWPAVSRVVGMGFVLLWVSLSHVFTLVSDPCTAMQLYMNCLTLGLFKSS